MIITQSMWRVIEKVGFSIIAVLVVVELCIAVLTVIDMKRFAVDCPVASVEIGDFWGKGDLVERVVDKDCEFVWLSNGDIVKRVQRQDGCAGFEVDYVKVEAAPPKPVVTVCFIGSL